jgi:ABC-type sugar transport system ATPase subunit
MHLSMSFLRLELLAKTWPDGSRAVRGVDLSIAEGEFVVLLGPSGCGKTTTLRMIAGLETPTSGRVHLAGRDVTGLPPGKRDVGFVFQFYALYPHLSVEENVAFPLECAKMPREERRAAVAAVAERLGIVPLLQRKPRELSGGDQQRVGLARFLGSPGMNLLEGEIRREHGQAVFRATGSTEAIALPRFAAAGPAVLGFRPERARLDVEGPLGGRVALDAFHGSCRYAHVEGPFGRVAVRAPAEAARAVGENVRVAIDPDGMRFFEVDSGARIA